MFAGISTNDAGVIRVAALSPLGAAIAQRTQHNVDYSMPVHVAAALIGALQRIGPAQPTSDADLPASAQPGDVPVVSRNWILETPRDVWQSVILPYLQPGDASAFARTSRASARVAQQDLDMRRAIRAKYTAYDAAWHYLIGAVNNEEAAEMRRAYPVAEMALALLLAYKHEPLEALDWTTEQYIARLRELRSECGRDGEALCEKPIMFPYHKEKIINGFISKAGSATLLCPEAILYFATDNFKRLPEDDEDYDETLAALINEVESEYINDYETPETPSFFATQYITGTKTQFELFLDFKEYAQHGVSLDRYDAAMWILYEANYVHSDYDGYEKFRYTGITCGKLRKKTKQRIAETPELRFDIPRTKTGQLSLLYMHYIILGEQTRNIIDIMRLNGTLEMALREPSRYNVDDSPPLLFCYDDPMIRSRRVFHEIIRGYFDLDKTLLWRQTFKGMRAFVYYMNRLDFYEFYMFADLVVNWRFNEFDGWMPWRPYSLESPELFENLPKACRYLEHAVDGIPYEVNDASYDLVLLAKEIARRGHILYDKMQASTEAENKDDARTFKLINDLLSSIADTIGNPPQYAKEYKEVVYHGMPQELRLIYEQIDTVRKESIDGGYTYDFWK